MLDLKRYKTEEFKTIQRMIFNAIVNESKSVIQIAKEIDLPIHIVSYVLHSSVKYGYIKETGMDEDQEYYYYGLTGKEDRNV